MSDTLDRLRASGALSGANAAYIEAMYEDWLQDPSTVSPDWRQRFESLDAQQIPHEQAHGPVVQAFTKLAKQSRNAATECISPDMAAKQAAVLRLINAYRIRGHQHANLDPLQRHEKPDIPDLDLHSHGLSATDMDTVFNTGSLFAEKELPLRKILTLVQSVYADNIGCEYMHITDTKQKRWIQEHIENLRQHHDFTPAEQGWILKMLTAAEGLEKYLHTRYVGQKRFSLEGGDSLIPLLDELIQQAGTQGVEEMVLGMAHRGRLNVLVNIMGKPPELLFAEFEGTFNADGEHGIGDVKYHKGFSTDVKTPGGAIHVVLAFNPSHLEIINPVVEGSVRARQHRRKDLMGNQVLPVLIHGDAAFAGQGVVMETLNLSQTRGYSTGGTVHIVINNQIGFTTSNPLDSRSTMYSTDVAKMVQAPIFHVNGDDPEAVIAITRLALQYRMTFHRDVVIDMVCYRRNGHNEADEPAVTQPMMYEKIRRHPPPRAIYAEKLTAEGVVRPEAVHELVEAYRQAMDDGHIVARPTLTDIPNPYEVDWSPYHGNDWDVEHDPRVPMPSLQALNEKLLQTPEGFKLHARVARIHEDRQKMGAGNKLLDWGCAETLAYATLLDNGTPIRLSGQDAGRGTFFHRHAVIHDQITGNNYTPLQHVSEQQADFVVIDSVLSEEAVLGFEYGYATAEPDSLTIWEAQFGDFVNGAQALIDQFIVSGEEKWGRLCGLTLYLPHGMEGQGAEHSSARPERFKQLCADHNIQLCVPTTPAQMYHLIRRQIVRPYRKPLVVLTPKSLLRHKLATSSLEELADGHFRNVIGEIDAIDPHRVKRLIMCTGKVFYDLLEARQTRGIDDIAIIRLEQLYPFPKNEFARELARYPHIEEMVWCQEEPQNQGMWDLIKHRFYVYLPPGADLLYVGRPVSAAPAVGNYKLHLKQQEAFINEALGACRVQPCERTD